MTTKTTHDFTAYSRDVFNSGAEVLGLLVWHSLRDLRIAPADLERLAVRHNVPTAGLPKLPHPADAFRSATRETQRRHGETRYLIRPVDDNGEQIVRHVIRERSDKRDLHYAPLAVFRFDKAAGVMEAAEVRTAPLGPGEADVVRQIIDDAREKFNDYRDHLTADELTRYFGRRLDAMARVRVHPTGGVYFVPRGYRAELAALQALAEDLAPHAVERGARMTFAAVPVPKLPDQIAQIEEGFRATMSVELRGLMADITELLGSTKKVKESTAAARLRDIAAARKKAEGYARLLGVEIAEIRDHLELLEGQANTLLDRIQAEPRPARRSA